jgi:hypothetical protein
VPNIGTEVTIYLYAKPSFLLVLINCNNIQPLLLHTEY